MKVLFINTSQNSGGAAIAADRLRKALNSKGIETEILVANKWIYKWHFLWERLIIYINNFFSRKNLFKISIANSGKDVTDLKVFKEADIIHLHWINQGMLSIQQLQKIIKVGKPIVWTMHDMWECTGICHYSYTCEGFKKECGNCFFLKFPFKKDLSYKIFKQKQKLYSTTAEIQFVAVSKWLEKQAKESNLLKGKSVCVIPNTLSTTTFTIHDKVLSRKELNFPVDKYIILFGAARIDDPIKGFSILIDAINYLLESNLMKKEQLHLVCFGNIKQEQTILSSIPISYSYLGPVMPTLLAKVYSAADVTISSSLYETFGQTIIEAQACGCLPVSFDNSGQTDIINHKKNGYLAKYLSIELLADGIYWATTKAQIDRQSLRNEVIQKYSQEVIAQQYIQLYNKMIK